MKTGNQRGWQLAVAGATAYAAFQAFQVTTRVPGLRWGVQFLLELPVWWAWCVVAAGIFWLSSRFPLERGVWGRHFLIHLAAATLLVIPAIVTIVEVTRGLLNHFLFANLELTNGEVRYLRSAAEPFFQRVFFYWRSLLGVFTLLYFAVVALYHAIKSQRALYEKSLQERELKAAVAEARLDALRMQLQPHFLFNTLNTVSAFMATDLGKSREVLARLSELLHESLKDGAGNETTIKREFELLQSYIDIQQVRFGDRLEVSATHDPAIAEAMVPKMVLQPLVENAIVHGMRQSGQLRVEVSAHTDGNTLVLSARDDGRGITPGDVVVEHVGIGNTRKRLEQLYGERGILHYHARQPGFETCVRLPLHFGEG